MRTHSHPVTIRPNSTQDVFEGGAGDAIFAPQGHFHYFENASETEDLIVLIVFNADSAEPLDDVRRRKSLLTIDQVPFTKTSLGSAGITQW